MRFYGPNSVNCFFTIFTEAGCIDRGYANPRNLSMMEIMQLEMDSIPYAVQSYSFWITHRNKQPVFVHFN